ncbi:TadE family protein [Selenomonas ruminantium]|nr:TadE/TadG family type IV pilus assembly protein [Selenomonas ruminantium]
MMKFQKGQSVMEFALILPLFFVFLFGIIYAGLLFKDYMMLSNMARSSARQASVSASNSADISQLNKAYANTKKEESDLYKGALHTSLYEFDPQNESDFSIYPVDKSGKKAKDLNSVRNVQVVIHAKLNKKNTLGKVFSNFFNTMDTFSIKYQMYQEKKQ